MAINPLKLHYLIDHLNIEQQEAVYKLLTTLVPNIEEPFTKEEIDKINNGFEEIKKGEYIGFNTVEEMNRHFKV